MTYPLLGLETIGQFLMINTLTLHISAFAYFFYTFHSFFIICRLQEPIAHGTHFFYQSQVTLRPSDFYVIRKIYYNWSRSSASFFLFLLLSRTDSLKASKCHNGFLCNLFCFTNVLLWSATYCGLLLMVR